MTIFLTREDVKDLVENEANVNRIEASIYAEILKAVAEQKYHCDWYSPAMYNMTDFDTEFVSHLVEELEVSRFKVTTTVFEPNKRFPNKRLKLHINWE